MEYVNYITYCGNSVTIFNEMISNFERSIPFKSEKMKKKLLLVISIACISCHPQWILAQAPDLGTASSFAVFTSTGAFGNTGVTVIYGDIGNNGSFITGFPPGTVTGSIHSVDAVSAGAASDLSNAYAFLSGLECGASEDVTMGNNQVITPGVYCLGDASTITGDLILDGLGNPNAVFVFQVNGTLTTGKFSNVALINLTSQDHVFWQVNGAVSLGDSSAFRGSILANGAVTLLEGAALAGRALSLSGAVALNTNTITITGNVIPLPIELLSFTGKCDQQGVILTWSTASESNNDHFSIERSTDAANWIVAGSVKGAGNSNTLRNYSLTDMDPCNSISYYRLQQTDLDGKFKYSRVISIANCLEALIELAIYPSPGSGVFNLSFKGDRDKVESITIYNTSGQKVYYSSKYQSVIDLSGKEGGTYFLHFQSASKTIVQKIMIKK